MPIRTSLPQVVEIINLDKFPDSLQSIEELAESYLEKLYYSYLYRSSTPEGDKKSFNINVVSYNRISYAIPGTELTIVVNPGLASGVPVTEVPLSLFFQLKIRKLIRGLQLQNFDGNPKSYLELLFKSLRISYTDLLTESIRTFMPIGTLGDFISLVNSEYSPTPLIQENSGADQDVYRDVLIQLKNSDLSLLNIVFQQFIQNTTFEESIEKLKQLFQKWINIDDVGEVIKDLFIPKISFSIERLALGIEFPEELFKPVDPNIPKSIAEFEAGSITFDTANGFVFSELGNISFTKSEILNSGFTLEINDLRFDLSRTSNIPEAEADGRPADFIGAYISDGTIGFPAFWNHDDGASTGELKVSNLLVGTGGISGTIGLRAKNGSSSTPIIEAGFGGSDPSDRFTVSLDAFDLTFQQNAIVGSDIQGRMKIPGFKDSTGQDAKIDIKIHIGTSGDFSVTASETQGVDALHLPGVFKLIFKTLTVGREDDRFFVAVSGALDFEVQAPGIGQFLPDKLDIQKLIIWQDGEFEFKGGTLSLPKAITLKIPPVELSVTAIGLGSHEQDHEGQPRKYKFFEFSGGININPGGVDARGDGIKFYHTIDDDDEAGKNPHRFVRIQGISIDLMIPGTATPETAAVLLKGYLAMKNPDPDNPAAGSEYAGAIDFSLPKLEMGGSAAMRLNPKVPAFIVDLGLEIATPIPLGTTGLGIYGFRGLIGQRYVADKEGVVGQQDAEWWQYYKTKTDPDNREGIFPAKFSQEDGTSLGAGVSLATSTDSGRTFSSKLFFLLSLPEVFLFQGQAQLLKERIGLDTTSDPPFFALIAISRQSIEAAFGVNYKMPDEGSRPGGIAKIDALIELGFFFGNASAWYLNIGRDLPESRRVNVRLLELFDAYFYLMIGSSGIRAGAGAKFEVEKKFGPLRAELGAYLDVAGKIAFKPKQYGASIHLGGKVGLYIFNFGVSVSVDAGLAAEAPKPFIVTGSLKVCVRILRKDRCAEFEFTWIFDNSLDTSPIAIMNPQAAAKAVNMLTRETFPLHVATGPTSSISPSLLDSFVVPMDSYIDFEFLKGVLPSANVIEDFGGNTQAVKYVDFVSPQKSKAPRVRHEYHLNSVKIYASDGSGWTDFSIYDAVAPVLAPFATADFSTLKSGYWQYHQPSLHNKLRVMAQTPLSFVSQGTGNYIVEETGITSGSIFCAPTAASKFCIDFKEIISDRNPGEVLQVIPKNTVRDKNNALIRVTGSDGHVINYPHYNINNALALKSGDTLEIRFKESVVTNDLRLFTTAPDVAIAYYVMKLLPDLSDSNLPQYQETLVSAISVPANNLVNGVIYDDLTAPIDKIIITAQESSATEPLFCTVNMDIRNDLERFLDTLSNRDQLLKPFNLYPNNNATYNGVFQGTSLYPAITDSNTVLQYKSIVSGSKLTILITDNFGFSATIELVKPSGTWTNTDDGDFFELGATTSSAGNNYDFEVFYNNRGDFGVTVSGKSSYPIRNCYNDRTLFFYRSCQVTFADALFNATAPSDTAIQAETDAMIAGLSQSIQPIWRPDTYYAIEMTVEDRLFKDNETTPLSETNVHTYSFGFRTKGPIGFFHQGNDTYDHLLGLDREAEFKLASLQHYIDYQKSYPNADGALINAKPLFYLNPELSLFYLKNYVVEFYRDWANYPDVGAEVKIELKTTIKDPAPDTTIAPVPPFSIEWLQNDLPGFIADAEILDNMINNDTPCAEVDPIEPQGINAYVELEELKPLKLYSAIFTARYKPGTATTYSESEVHKYVFQTSRYANFEEQVNSYVLERDETDPTIITKDANFNVDLALSASNFTTAQLVVNGSLSDTSGLHKDYAEDYDKVIVGMFGLGKLAPAMTTEFNVLKSNGSIVGVLVRNPEPFNDPKIPQPVLENTISVNAGSVILNRKIFSKDGRNVLITNDMLVVTPGIYDFEFNYKQWTGADYADKASSTVSININ